jgi:hypothetical protein
VVGVGGGLIKPMQQRWDRYLDKAEEESKNIREQVSSGKPSDVDRSSQMPAMATSGYSTQSYQQPPTGPRHDAGYSPGPYQQSPSEPQHGGGYQQPQPQYPPQSPQPGQQGGYGQQYPGQQYPGQQYPPSGDQPPTRREF